MSRNRTCCFAGYDPQFQEALQQKENEGLFRMSASLTEAAEYLINEKKVCHFISGMSRGVNLLAASLIVDLKTKYPEITLECVIPFETQAKKWNEKEREMYYNTLSVCDDETMLKTHYTSDCLLRQDMYMVRRSSYAVTVWDGRPIAAGNTVNYAIAQGLNVVRIDPETFTFENVWGCSFSPIFRLPAAI